eukprot:TRINITY_DN960_c0_g1_i3.p2 TRINITY_DN960_c0_g1~~TRINITY_DN960_c0_g1_i3.p2  ORF type:complete len:315 (-),score=39.64 TRINITY_DN960_c0_g1_i3:62-1006(-)
MSSGSSSSSTPAKVYYGMQHCEEVYKKTTRPCKNLAYYKQGRKYLCGQHSDANLRKELEKPPQAVREAITKGAQDKRDKEIEEAKQENRRLGRRGNIIMHKQKMMKSVEHTPGYLSVYPNYKDQNKKDGFGCSRLSPKSLGPIEHGQPDLPPARNLENFHQGSKMFREECDENENPTPLYYKNRLNFYQDPEPHRHKYLGTNTVNKNIPVCFLWVDKDKKEHRLSYVQSRQFYCNLYERLASREPDFLKLREMVDSGTNIQICGYDARWPIEGTIEENYLDPKYPFGHEFVLFAMLMINNPEEYPWRKHKTFEF